MNNGKVGMTRRNFLRGITVLGAGSLLVACAPAGQPAAGGGSGAAPSGAAKTIQHWVFWNQPEKVKDDLMKTASLKAALGNNTLEFRTGVTPDAGLTAIAGGTPPDLGVLQHYTDYMIKGVAVPLDDYLSASKLITKDQFIDGNIQVCTYEGKLGGLPSYECFVRRGLNYNTRMVSAAGLDPEKPPVTWDELMDWHKTLTKFDSAGNLLQIGIDPFDAEGGTGPGNDGWFLAESWGFDYFDPDTKKFNLDNELLAQGLDTMGEFVKLIGPDNLAGMRNVEGQGTWGPAYNAEKQAMIIEGYWHPGETANEKPDVSKVNVAHWVPVPEARRGKQIQFGGGHMAQIYKDSKNKDEAWAIAEWTQSQEFCDIIFNKIGWLPAYKPYFDKADPNKYPGLKFYFDSLKEANFWGKFIVCPIDAFIETKVAEAREAVYRGQMTGAQAAAKLQQQAEEEWKNSGNG